jgi:citrate synthase
MADSWSQLLSPSFLAWKLASIFGSTSLGESNGTLTVTDNRTNRKYTIPIVRNYVKATDFRRITAAGLGADPADQVESGLKILDRGYLNTACMESAITFIDGKRGYIQYRDYSIEHVFKNNDFEDAAHLVMFGNLPSPAEKLAFRRALVKGMDAPQSVIDVIQAFPRDSLTFPMILAGLSAFAGVDPGTEKTHHEGRAFYLGNMKETDAAIIRTLAGLATVIAITYCHKRGKQFTPANPDLTFVENTCWMMGFVKDGKPDPQIVECFDKLWILYADHEMTNSTAAVLHAASTLTDPISSLVSGIVSAYGPLHGGAIDLAYKGFEEVGTVENVPSLINDVKAKKQRLFGYGHRIYKVADPRSKFIRQMIAEKQELVDKNPMLRIAMEIDRVANEDPYFVSRNLKANADLYGCFLYTAMGFETDIIVAMACLSRTPGAMAHWRESMQQGPMLWRPLQVFTGNVTKAAEA